MYIESAFQSKMSGKESIFFVFQRLFKCYLSFKAGGRVLWYEMELLFMQTFKKCPKSDWWNSEMFFCFLFPNTVKTKIEFLLNDSAEV